MSADHSAVEAHVVERLRAQDQRFTTQRRTLVELLRGAGRPLSMPELLDSNPALAQSSVYRNLVVLEQAGVVLRVVTGDEFARYELAEDLTGHHHHHLVCVSCGFIVDVTVPTDLEERIDATLGGLAAEHGFSVLDHRLDLLGNCANCREPQGNG
ncbi:MAG: transcriptional repressor [Actinobacteria bacterium]|nr:transcriptional repressor [Actinomycetota bacterium]